MGCLFHDGSKQVVSTRLSMAASAVEVFQAPAAIVGEALGEYRGRVISLHQAIQLENRDYLMGGFG